VATLYIRNVPERVVDGLKQRAVRHGRSLNAEVVSLLGEAAPELRPLADVLAEIRQLAAEIALEPGELEEVDVIRQGREDRMRRVLGE
jgi:plasmid stability protein